MLNKTINFIKYNNLTVLIVLAVFLLSTGVFAQTETGQAVIGEKQTTIQGFDSALLNEADLDSFDMDYKIEKIEQDDKYYYVTYTYLDLVKKDSAWQYQMQEKIKKISLKLKEDLGTYIAEELAEEYESRIKDLKSEKEKIADETAEKRIEVTEYSGLIGQTLAMADRIFPNYESVKKYEVPTPTVPPTILQKKDNLVLDGESTPDNLTEIYNEYLAENDPDGDDVFGILDNCPNDYNPDQLDADEDNIGDACDLENNMDEPEESTTDDTDADDVAEDEQAEEIEIQEEADQEDDGADEQTEIVEEGAEEPASVVEESTEPEYENVEVIELPVE